MNHRRVSMIEAAAGILATVASLATQDSRPALSHHLGAFGAALVILALYHLIRARLERDSGFRTPPKKP